MSKKDAFLTILGLLIMVPIMVAAVWAVVGDILKVFFVENLGETLRSIGIFALVICGFYIVARVINSMFGSKSSHYPNTIGRYPDNWDEISKQVKRRDGYICGNCGSTTNLHAHHIVPRSKGGTDNLSNLRTLCSNCHKILHPHMRN